MMNNTNTEPYCKYRGSCKQ